MIPNWGTVRVQSVDLASRYTATVLAEWSDTPELEPRVYYQYDSWRQPEDGYLERVAQDAQVGTPAVVVVEDLPHRLPFDHLVRRVCRLQGRLVEKLTVRHQRDLLLFVPPTLWQQAYTGIYRKGPRAVVAVAAEYGYTSPVDYTEHHHEDRVIARKVGTDYCAAFLIGRWAAKTWWEMGTFDVAGTSRYVTYEEQSERDRGARRGVVAGRRHR